MRKPTISFAIVSFSLLVLAGCNTANQNTYSAASTPVDARKAEILQTCNLIYNGYLMSPGAFGTNLVNGTTARANCLIQFGYYKD